MKANELQRLTTAINLDRLLFIYKNEATTPLRLLVQGTAGTGKTYIIRSLSYIARRMEGRNNAVLNLAPTGSAANLLPMGRTVHSTAPPKRNTKNSNTVQMSDYPLSIKKYKNHKKLQQIVGLQEHQTQLKVLNIDERSMFSKSFLGWCSQRFTEVTNNNDNSFGSIPIVNFFGDLGQLGPVESRALHIRPAQTAAPAELAGLGVYRDLKT